MERESGPRTVRYVTQDPIQNLRIRVTLTRLTARGPKPDAPAAADSGGSARSGRGPTAQDAAAGDAAAGGAGAAAAAPQPQEQALQAVGTRRPSALQLSRVFGWQEKVYSRSEVAAAREAARGGGAAAARGRLPWRRAERFGSQLRPGAEDMLVRNGRRQGKSAVEGWELALGMATVRTEHNTVARCPSRPQASSQEGSQLFSYVHTDDFCDRTEASKVGGVGRRACSAAWHGLACWP
jgi:Meckel syndrome type 1 protein